MDPSCIIAPVRMRDAVAWRPGIRYRVPKGRARWWPGVRSVDRLAGFPRARPLLFGLLKALDRFLDDSARILDLLGGLLLFAGKETAGDANLVGEDLGAQVAEDLEQARRRVEELSLVVESHDQFGESTQIDAKVFGRDVVVESHDAHTGCDEGDSSAAIRAGSDASTGAPGAGAGHGKYRMNVERAPTMLSATSSPPRIRARCREIARPSPVPRGASSSWMYSPKMDSSSSLGIPGPVSSTANPTHPSAPGRHAGASSAATGM